MTEGELAQLERRPPRLIAGCGRARAPVEVAPPLPEPPLSAPAVPAAPRARTAPATGMIDAHEPHRAAHAASAAATTLAAPAADPMRVALEVEIPSDVRFIERIVALVVQQCVEFRYPKHACTLNVPVALSEALSNAILRGNRENAALSVRVRACVDARELVLEVEDEGEGFEFERCAKDPTLPENLEREDGRGLFLMRRLMDRVERYQEADGNVVRLVLHRAGDGA